MSQRYLSTPWHRAPNVGDADVKRHRYLIVTHSAPLYPHHHNSLHNARPPHQTSPYCSLNCVSLFNSPSLHSFSVREDRETYETKNEKWKLRVWIRQHTSRSFFEDVQSRWQGRQWRYILYGAYLNFKRAYIFSKSTEKQFSAKPALRHRYL